jgi:IS30 family transposase
MMNPTERAFIEKTATTLTIPEIARQINRDEDTIRSYCKRKGIEYKNGKPGKKKRGTMIFEQTPRIQRPPAVYDNLRSPYNIYSQLRTA